MKKPNNRGKKTKPNGGKKPGNIERRPRAGIGDNTDVEPEQVVDTNSAEEADTNNIDAAAETESEVDEAEIESIKSDAQRNRERLENGIRIRRQAEEKAKDNADDDAADNESDAEEADAEEADTESDDDDADFRMTVYTAPASDPKGSEKRLYVRTAEKGKLHPPPIDPALMLPAQPYIDIITGVHKGQVEGIFKIGNTLIAAKKALAHGVFGHMIEHQMPFGQRFADMYMAVARNKILSKWKSISILPASVAVLYELDRIEDDKLEELRADGSIHAGLRRGEAVQLRKRIHKEVGSHNFPDLKTALRVLDWFADKYSADPEPIGELIYHATVDSNADLEIDLGAISTWIAKLSAIDDRLYEEDQAEEQRKAAEEKARKQAAWERREAARVAATSSDDDEGEDDDVVERQVAEQE